jgi:hypothetical protein
MPGDPKQCREYAHQCAEMAQRARNPEHRKTLTQLAQAWLGVAAELERSQTLLDAYPEPTPTGAKPPGPRVPH